MPDLTPSDLAQLAGHGLAPAEASRQLAQLRHGQTFSCLVRPCTVGDGIRQLPASCHAALSARFARAAKGGQVVRFVPASGAATRMFQPLQTPLDNGGELQRFLADLERFPFYPELVAVLAQSRIVPAVGREELLPALLGALLEPAGLGYARLPKGLLAFHRSAGEVRTAFVEHLAETAQLVGPGQPARLHLTVSPEHLPLFARQLSEWSERLTQLYATALEVRFSVQDPATDTLALGPDGGALRDPEGRLVLRPGGHGALLRNLAALEADVVLLRNIDNVVPDGRKEENLRWDRLLGGLLLALVDRQRELVARLRRDPADAATCAAAGGFLRDELEVAVPPGELTGEQLLALLDRPLRVCGMVRNSGEPGGGPFWSADGTGGVSRQIIETSQVERSDPAQAAILAAATHFNPVDMACCLRDGDGRLYPLESFVDQQAAIVTEKVQNGQAIRILERPGLWNGAMAGWHTVFIELPESTFNPVKTIFDLLRPAHQP